VIEILDCSEQEAWIISKVAQSAIALTAQQTAHFAGFVTVINKQPLGQRTRNPATDCAPFFLGGMYHLVLLKAKTMIGSKTALKKFLFRRQSFLFFLFLAANHDRTKDRTKVSYFPSLPIFSAVLLFHFGTQFHAPTISSGSKEVKPNG
jgi:hypothetical protein